jgi:hypothetical protein
MARKGPADLKAAKEKKQKKIAIGGAVLLVILLIVQVPKTMKMLNSGQEASEPPVTAPDPSQPPAAPPSSDPLAPPTLEAANPSEAVAPAPAPAAEPSAQLVSFSRFESKDPFAQQIGAESAAPEPGAGPADAPPDDGILEPDPDEPRKAVGGGGDQAPPQYGSAEISVNGVVETVALEAAFPQAAPMFLLDALEAKSATIKVAEGGSFASGGGTLELEVGKPLTLVNTADGTRFVVELKSVS